MRKLGRHRCGNGYRGNVIKNGRGLIFCDLCGKEFNKWRVKK